MAQELEDDVVVDWTRGVVVARGAAPGDLRAPSPAIARVKARRQAHEDARARLAAAVGRLPMAGGGTVADAAQGGKAVSASTDAATVLRETFGSDGSVTAELGLGIEAVRTALGEPASPGTGDVAVIVVDAHASPLTPAVALVLRAGASQYAGPTLYVTRARDAESIEVLGPADGTPPRRLRARARSVAGGVIELGGVTAEELDRVRAASALVIVVVKPPARKLPG